MRYVCPNFHYTYSDKEQVQRRIECPACGLPAGQAPEDQKLTAAQLNGCCLARNASLCVKPPCPMNPDCF